MKKKDYKPMTQADIKWRDKTFSKKEQDACLLAFGCIPMYDETFVRNSELFKKHLRTH